jgi:lactose/L-arabinose transport system substrate-binding protein
VSRRTLFRLGAGTAAAVAVPSVLGGCSPGNLSGSGATSAKLSSSPATSLSGEVTIWDRQGDLFKVFDHAIKGFEKKYPKVKVNHVAVDVDGKLPKTLVSGTNVPDGSFWEDVNLQGSADHLTDLSDLLAPYKKDIIQFKLDVNTIGGRTVGVPWDLDPGLLYYREDVLEQAGVDPNSLTTYDSLVAAARTIKQRNPAARPIHIEGDPAVGQLWLEMFANQQGTAMIDENGKLQLDSPKYRQILTWMHDVVTNELGTPTKYLQPTDIATLENGTQSLVPFAIWFDYAPQLLLNKTKGKWRATLLPAWNESGARSGIMGGSSFVIPAKSRNPELAWKVFEYFVFDPDGYRAVYGPGSIYPNGLNTSLPSYKPALQPDKPLFKPVPALGNQDLWSVFTKAAAQVPGGYRIAPWYNQAVPYLGNNLQQMLQGKMSVDDCLSQSAEKIQKNLVER